MANFYGQYVGFGAGVSGAAFSFPVSTYGYVLGGGGSDMIQRYSTVSDADAVDWADLSAGKNSPASGQRSIDYGYAGGGDTPKNDHIDKFPFASQTDATNVGSLTAARSATTGASSGVYCYNCAGHGPGNSTVIDKFTVASDNDSTDVGDALHHGAQGYGASSTTHGYKSAGYNASPSPAGNSAVIQKFSFSSDGDATLVGETTTARDGRVSESSLTHGYCGNDYYSATKLDKFTFASDSDATDVGNLAGAASRGQGGGASSVDNGYFATGWNVNVINKFAHASDGDGADVADLATVRTDCSGTHG